MKRQHVLKKGFTIVELIIYTAILSSFLIVLTQVFTSSLNAELSSQSVSNVEEDARFILLRITHDISLATAITTPSAPGVQTSSLVMTVSGQTDTYSVNGGNLLLNGVQLNSLATVISNVTFTRLGPAGGNDAIMVTMTVTDTTLQSGGGQKNKVYTATVTTRCNGLSC